MELDAALEPESAYAGAMARPLPCRPDSSNARTCHAAGDTHGTGRSGRSHPLQRLYCLVDVPQLLVEIGDQFFKFNLLWHDVCSGQTVSLPSSKHFDTEPETLRKRGSP